MISSLFIAVFNAFISFSFTDMWLSEKYITRGNLLLIAIDWYPKNVPFDRVCSVILLSVSRTEAARKIYL